MALSPAAMRYLAGNRVYRGSSSAPTRGTVDPSGYIEREQNKSMSRSGLAAAALQRQRAGSFNRVTGPTSSAPTGPTYTRQPAPQTGDMRLAPPSPASNNKGQVFAKPTPINAAPIDLPSKELLPRPVQGGQLGLGFDPEGADAQEDAFRQKNQALRQLLEQEQNLERDYVTNARDVEQQRPEALRNLLNSFAGRGMAFSSGYASEVGETEGQFAKFLSQLAESRNRGRNSIDRGRTDIDENFNGALAAIQRGIARRQAQRAGDLGIGGPPTTGRPSPIPFTPGPSFSAGPQGLPGTNIRGTQTNRSVGNTPVVIVRDPATGRSEVKLQPNPEASPLQQNTNAAIERLLGKRTGGINALVNAANRRR